MESRNNFSKIESIKPKEVISFEDLDLYLDDSEWELKEEKSNSNLYEATEIAVNFNGVELMLNRTKTVEANYVCFEFELSKGSAKIEIDIDIFKGEIENVPLLVETCIVREDALKGKSERVLPNGLGAVAYQKMLDFLQSLANYNKKEYQHIVSRVFEMSEEREPLSKERWEQIFLPLLNKGDRQYMYFKDYLLGVDFLKEEREESGYYDSYKYTYVPKKVIKKEAA